MKNANIGLTAHITNPDLHKWESVSKHIQNNAAALNSEMSETLQNLKDYMKKLENYMKLERLRKKGVLNTDGDGENMDKQLKDNLLQGHAIMNKTKHLLFLERESDWTIKPFNSLSVKSSDISNVNSSLSYFPPSPSNVSCYTNELQDILKQLSNILSPKEVKSVSKLDFMHDNKHLQEFLVSNNSLDFLEFLNEHVAKTNHQLKFSLLPTGNTFEHAYTCRLLHLSVQGKARNKLLARKKAAMNLVQLLIDLQHRNALPDTVNPFTREELNMLTVQLCEIENYTLELKSLCSKKHMKPPTFSILQSNPVFTVQCSALGQIALGSNENKMIAKRLAAKRTIELFKKSTGVA